MLKNILLVRHCEAERPNSDYSDYDVELSSQGTLQAIDLAQSILHLKINFTEIASSTATRTLQTARHIIGNLEKKPVLTADKKLYNDNGNYLMKFINRRSETDKNIILVIHNKSMEPFLKHIFKQSYIIHEGNALLLSFKGKWNDINFAQINTVEITNVITDNVNWV
jgi:phosphohistidine phosphatase